MRWIVAVLLVTTLAGCITSIPEPTGIQDPSIHVEGVLLDKEDDTPIAGASITLEGLGISRQTTNQTGGFDFKLLPGECTLTALAEGFVEGVFATDCSQNRFLTIRLGRILSEVVPPTPVNATLPEVAPDVPRFQLSGTVRDGAGNPLSASVSLTLDNETVASHQTGDTGTFAFLTTAGSYSLEATRVCAAPVKTPVNLQGNRTLDLVLGDAITTLPPVPTGLKTVPGPGPGMVTLQWDRLAADPPIHHFEIHRDGARFMSIGNAQAWADTTPNGHDYAITASNVCGLAGTPTATVAGTPLPGYETLIETSVRSGSGIKTTSETFTVLNAAHEPIGTRTFNSVQGVGNCCETYVAADKTGRLFEYGGSYILYSDDKGASWSQVNTPIPKVGAEGAIVQAPGGDILAFNWDPYTGDQLWIQKWIAATDTWVYQQIVLHQPFYDRPWVAVIEGPFEFEGVVAPYLTFVMSNYVHADIMQMSLDGINFFAPSQRSLTQLGGTVPINWDLPIDPERDWIQAIREADIVPIDDGQGLRGRTLLSYCDWAAIAPDLLWGCPTWGSFRGEALNEDSIRVDSLGNIHWMVVPIGGKSFEYRVSQDAGVTWQSVRANIPRDMIIEDWDSKVHGGLDQAVLSVRASVSEDESTIDQDMLFRFRGTATTPYLDEIILVGKGDHVFGGGLNSAYDRFDYTTVTLLPDGSAALSFGDSAHNPPAIAIEQ